MVQEKITGTDILTIRLETTLYELISGSPPSPPIFVPDALPATTLLIYPGLGQEPNMLACIPTGLVWGHPNKGHQISGVGKPSIFNQ